MRRDKNKCICGKYLPCPVLDPWYYIGKERYRKFKNADHWKRDYLAYL